MKNKLDFAMQINSIYYFSNALIQQFNLQDRKGLLVLAGSNVLRFKINDEIITINKLQVDGDLSKNFSLNPFFTTENSIVLHTTIGGFNQFVENITAEENQEIVEEVKEQEEIRKEEIVEEREETIEAQTEDVLNEDGEKLEWY